jgi:hypothetical protein
MILYDSYVSGSLTVSGSATINENLNLIGNLLSNGTNLINFSSNTILYGYAGSWTSHQWYTGGTAKMQIISNGNLIVQNAGTFTDNGYRLQINGSGSASGSVFISGTSRSDYPILGSELLTTGDGTAWSGSSFSTGYAHTSGSSTVALTSSLVATSGQYYQAAVTVTNRTIGSFTFSFGGVTTVSISSTTSFPIAATTTAPNFALTPTIDFDGTASVSLKQITAVSNPTLTISSTATSSVANNLEIRVASGSGSPGNTFIGYQAGRYNTTANSNTFIGYAAGSVNISSLNTFIGYQAGLRNTSGGASNLPPGNGGNTFVGANAGAANTIGHTNAFIGANVGNNNIGGSYNVALGSTVFNANTSGQSNIAIGGYGTLFSNSVGSNNTAIGSYTLGNNQSGSSNTAVGASAFQSLILGSDNTALGQSIGTAILTGSNNVIIGTQAANKISGGSVNATQVQNSILIGYRAYPLADSQSYQIVIGTSAVGLGTNTTIIGTNQTTTTALRGNLLLGTTGSNGTDILQVTGSSSFTGSVNINGSLTTTGTNNLSGNTSYLGTTTFFSTAVSGPLNYGGSTVRIVGGTGTSAAGIQFGPADTNTTGARGRIGFVASANNGNPKEFAIIKGVLDSTGANTCNGSLTFHTLNGDNATEASVRMTIDGNGSIGAPSGTNIYNASDIRLKQNVSTINEGLNSILALNPVKFNWINNFVPAENGKNMFGFIAQEVQAVLPEVVESFGGNSITVEDTIIENPLRVNEKYIIPVLVKAIQEQQVQIELLKEILQRNNIL